MIQQYGYLHSPQPMNTQNFKILLYEENQLNQKIILLYLSRFGFSADSVISRNQLEETLKLHKYQLLLYSGSLKQHQDIESIQQLHHHAGLNNLPVILVSDQKERMDKNGLRQSGIYDVIQKPVKIGDLIATVSQVFDSHTQGKNKPDAPEPQKQPTVLSVHEDQSGPLIFDKDSFFRRMGGLQKLCYEIINDFIMTVPDDFSKLQEAMNQSDFPVVKRLVHTFKGTCSNIEALSMFEISLKMDLLAKADRFNEIEPLFCELKKEYEKFKKHVLKEGHCIQS